MWALYEMDALLREVLDLFMDPETGEISPEGEKRLDALAANREKLLLDLACAMKESRAERDAVKAEADKLYERAKRCDRHAEAIARQLLRFVNPGEKLKDARASISWRKSKALVLLVEVGALTDRFKRIKEEADLGKLREALESERGSSELDGVAKIEERVHLQVR